MGWSMPDESEKFSLQQMLDNFDVQRVSLGGPIFDIEKLSWLNGMWIREDLDHEQLAQRLKDWYFNQESLMKILPHAQQSMETLSDYAP
jgi:glutamyl-tRNA synthetase